VAAQISHIQLAPRFMVPVAFWMAIRFLDTGRANYLHLLLAACAYQIYLGIYTGYFLILSIIPFWLALFLIRKQWIAVGSFIEDSERRLLFHRALGYATSGIAFVLVLLPLAIPYYQTQRLMGCWAWDEVVIMLPRWRSYLYGPDSFVWGHICNWFGNTLPMRHEHKLFPGILPYLSIAVFLYLCWKKENSSRTGPGWLRHD
jgi:hypothetical protein